MDPPAEVAKVIATTPLKLMALVDATTPLPKKLAGLGKMDPVSPTVSNEYPYCVFAVSPGSSAVPVMTPLLLMAVATDPDPVYPPPRLISGVVAALLKLMGMTCPGGRGVVRVDLIIGGSAGSIAVENTADNLPAIVDAGCGRAVGRARRYCW